MGTALKLTQTLVLRDPDNAGHATRVTELALRLAAALDVSPERIKAIKAGGPLHDIGKLELDRAILDKPGALDPEELKEIRAHPELGARMLRGIKSLRPSLNCVLHHHERWDGDGYPSGLGGEAIPLEARILAVADAYDAMTSQRPYREPRTREEALAEVERCAGSQFDPQIARAFLSL
ncbi:MAG TPA: HD-GYP domain-containing protein [Gaiellaceae bacterium]|jgi:putative nucleotidyltransferase with HDIG domain|nr:HD-GYP domain-containing protein [Gaiellaceae bacterium]